MILYRWLIRYKYGQESSILAPTAETAATLGERTVAHNDAIIAVLRGEQIEAIWQPPPVKPTLEESARAEVEELLA